MRNRSAPERSPKVSIHHAHSFALQLREIAMQRGYDPFDIKVLDLRASRARGFRADASVVWETGPDNWTSKMIIPPSDLIWTEPRGGYIMTFFDL